MELEHSMQNMIHEIRQKNQEHADNRDFERRYHRTENDYTLVDIPPPTPFGPPPPPPGDMDNKVIFPRIFLMAFLGTQKRLRPEIYGFFNLIKIFVVQTFLVIS
jgi:hypothetical protein